MSDIDNTLRCTSCHEKAFDYEPDMGDDFATHAPGKCDVCETVGIVWRVTF